MALDKASPRVLMDELYQDIYSDIFTVMPGQIVIVRGFGFVEHTSERPIIDQHACLHMMLFKDVKLPEFNGCSMPLFKLEDYPGVLLVEDEIRTFGGCTWKLSKCHNVILIDIPGSYRFVLNDPNAVGYVRIYANEFTHNEFPRYSNLFVGENHGLRLP